MRNQIDNWLTGDCVVLGINIEHWVVALAAVAVVALLVAWFERPKRTPERSSPRLPRTVRSAS
jgi:quercetin dioxygenase-like cupin family protein